MKFSVKEIYPKVFVLIFDSRYDLCMSFVRIQEFYESPKFRNKYFELEEYMDWWAKEYGNGSFDYPSRWSGFNIPGQVISKWINKVDQHEGLYRAKERQILNGILKLLDKDATFFGDEESINLFKTTYVIGLHKENQIISHEALNHEMSHAFYTLYLDYRKASNSLLAKIPKQKLMSAEAKLLKMGYNSKVIKDELQAYFSTTENECEDWRYLWKRKEFVDNFQNFKDSLEKKAE